MTLTAQKLIQSCSERTVVKNLIMALDSGKLIFFVFFTGSIVLNFFTIHGQVVNTERCENLSVPACMNLGYNRTYLPNLLGETTQVAADASLSSLTPLLDLVTDQQCRSYLHQLLCSAYLPQCVITPDNEGVATISPLSPCEDYCTFVLTDCADGLPLPTSPEALGCGNLPSTNCLDARNNRQTTTPRGNQVTDSNNQGQCQQISIELCSQSIGYNQTFFPNVRGKLISLINHSVNWANHTFSLTYVRDNETVYSNEK